MFSKNKMCKYLKRYISKHTELGVTSKVPVNLSSLDDENRGREGVKRDSRKFETKDRNYYQSLGLPYGKIETKNRGRGGVGGPIFSQLKMGDFPEILMSSLTLVF